MVADQLRAMLHFAVLGLGLLCAYQAGKFRITDARRGGPFLLGALACLWASALV